MILENILCRGGNFFDELMGRLEAAGHGDWVPMLSHSATAAGLSAPDGGEYIMAAVGGESYTVHVNPEGFRQRLALPVCAGPVAVRAAVLDRFVAYAAGRPLPACGTPLRRGAHDGPSSPLELEVQPFVPMSAAGVLLQGSGGQFERFLQQQAANRRRGWHDPAERTYNVPLQLEGGTALLTMGAGSVVRATVTLQDMLAASGIVQRLFQARRDTEAERSTEEQ